jgi:hypothetical protein
MKFLTMKETHHSSVYTYTYDICACVYIDPQEPSYTKYLKYLKGYIYGFILYQLFNFWL